MEWNTDSNQQRRHFSAAKQARAIGCVLLRRCYLALFVFVWAYSTARAEGEGASTRLVMTDKVVGRTMRYLGISGMTEGPSWEMREKYIRDSGANTTKYWEIWDKVKDALSHRKYLYGPETKAIAIRQAEKELDDIDWALELFGGQQAMDKMVANYDFLKRIGIEPLVNLLAKRRIVGQLEEEVLWRWMFLYNIWANKVKDYDFPLWEAGCENGRRLSLMNAEIGSDALREAERITGVKILVAAAGHHDWRKVALTEVIELLLTGEAGQRLDVLSYHSFAYRTKFPKLDGYPTYPEWLATLDAIQKKYRKDKPPLPWWDTSWGWQPRRGEASSPAHADLLSAVEYLSRFMWESQCGVEYSCVYKLFTREGKEGGLVRLKEDGSTRLTKPYYAVRMAARAIVSSKERLAVEGAPRGLGFVVLASRDKDKTYLTLVNRGAEEAANLEVIWPAKLKGRSYSVREVGEKADDEQISQGVLPASLRIQVAPLSAKQIITERGF